jgi:hypothetical protein
MAIGTTFGTIHSNTDLGLIQQSVEVQPASPKTLYTSLPAADGSLDMTEAFGRVMYDDRDITWTFALYPKDGWSAKQREVSNALNGLNCHIILDEDPDYYYDGRLIVNSYKRDKLLKQIVIKARCRPYKYEKDITTVTQAGIGAATSITLSNDRMPVIPEITVDKGVKLTFGTATLSHDAGTFTWTDLVLVQGDNTVTVEPTGDPVTISITYRKGAL